MTPAKSGRPGMAAGEVFFEMAEKKQLPDFWFFGRGGIDVWRSQRRLPRKMHQQSALRRIMNWRAVIH
jgi:hypothetical protein